MSNKKYTINYINTIFQLEGYKLLTTFYLNPHQNLDFICPKGHEHKIKWADWKNGIRCGKCYKPNLTYEQIKTSFENEGYELLTTKYINSKQNLNFICPNGHEHKITWNCWNRGQRCGKCVIKWTSKSEKEILSFIKNNYKGIIKPNDRTLIKYPRTKRYLELDIWLPDIKKAIEYNGEYWHTGYYRKLKDDYKKQWCKENNIELLVIDDYYWNKWKKENNFNILLSFIL